MLGKRKRELQVATRQPSAAKNEPEEDANSSKLDQDAFRRYFESVFEPLPESKTDELPDSEAEEEMSPSEDESAWEGLSDAGQTPPLVQVVEHVAPSQPTDEDGEFQRRLYKSFMTAKLPNQVEGMVQKANPGKQAGDDEESEAMNLKHDLDLQRLLRESHLLEQAKASSLPGAYRHKAVDMRMQTLGSKDSLFTQEKMPMAHRKGISAKAASREAMRRKDAKENGIILEKAAGGNSKGKSQGARRQRGVDAPRVGRFRGGTLNLSKHDVLDIQGPRRSGAGRKKGRR